MLIDINKKEGRLNFLDINFKKYDYVIIGTGPSGTVLIDSLLKKKKKLLVIERGNFQKKKYESVISKKIKIKKKSKTFAVGGTSLDWSQIYSYLDQVELSDRSKLSKKNNTWPFNYSELITSYTTFDKKFKFDFKKLKNINLDLPFLLRKFVAPIKPCNFGKLLNYDKIDLLVNCKVNTIDNKYNNVQLYLHNRNFRKVITVKNLIICNGGIESTSLILRSIKDKKLQGLKNKNIVGKFFMDHPKSYAGVIKYPKNDIIEKISLKKTRNQISYYGLSLTKNEQYKKNLLNTYLRFEKTSLKSQNIVDPFFKSIKYLFNYFKLNNSKINTDGNPYNIRVFFEMLPSIKNSIKIDKSNRININLNYSRTEIKTYNILIKKVYRFFSNEYKKENIKLLNKKNVLNLKDASHHMGGLIYPSIVDQNLKFRGLRGIYCCASSIFPTSGSVNPTYTTCALALRLGKYLN